MATRLVSKNWTVEGVLTNVTSAKLSDPTGTYGIKRNDTDAVVVADDTAMTNSATGVYEYSFTDVEGVAYTAYVEFVYDGATYHFEVDVPARAATDTMVASYSSLLARVGHYLFGIRTGFSVDQTNDIEDCIKDGLQRVYSAHEWSFYRPLNDVVTTAPYATGTVTIASGVVTLTGGTFPSWAADGVLYVNSTYYSVDSRDSDTQITLDDTTVTDAVASSYELGRPEIAMDATFDSVANDSDLTFYPTADSWWPPVTMRHDSAIRKMEQGNPDFDRPVYYSVRTVEFDPTVGSRKVLAFYPTPDQAYTMRVPMILRQTMIDATNQYPIGGEILGQVILEACLASAEHNFEERNKIHEERFIEQIQLAIVKDQERSSPTSLGPDAPRTNGRFNMFDYNYRLREQRIGQLTLNGDVQ